MFAEILTAVSITEKNRPKSKNNLGLFWWRWTATEAPLRSLLRNLRFLCPFCFAKDGLCGFDYLKKRTQTENRFRFVLVEMAVIETASENPSSMLSTSVGGLLSFPRRCADRQAHRFGIL